MATEIQDDVVGASAGELLLITQSYPYGKYTEFLDDEIEYLAAAFQQVTIAPFNPLGPLQPLPRNVVVDRGLVHASERSKRLRALASALGLLTLVGELRSLKVRPSWSLIGKVALAAGQYAMIRRWARRRPKPSVVYTYWLGPPTAALADELVGTPVISRVHGGDLFWENYDPPVIPLQRRAIGGATLTASVSRPGRDYLAIRYPELADRFIVAPLGIVTASRTAEASTDGTVRVLSVSSLSEVKRPVLLAEVIGELGSRVPSVEWHHFGDGPLRGDVEQKIAGLPPSVRVIMHGQTDHDDLIRHLVDDPWDVFVNVSSMEGVPVSIMEVLSAGIPVTAPAVGGIPDVVDAESNRLVDADADPGRIAEVVLDVLDPSASGRRARKTACDSKYSAAMNYTAFAQRLSDLAASR